MGKMRRSERIVLSAIGSLVVLEIVAMSLGFNGVLLRTVTMLIAGLAGLAIPADKIKQLKGVLYD